MFNNEKMRGEEDLFQFPEPGFTDEEVLMLQTLPLPTKLTKLVIRKMDGNTIDRYVRLDDKLTAEELYRTVVADLSTPITSIILYTNYGEMIPYDARNVSEFIRVSENQLFVVFLGSKRRDPTETLRNVYLRFPNSGNAHKIQTSSKELEMALKKREMQKSGIGIYIAENLKDEDYGPRIQFTVEYTTREGILASQSKVVGNPGFPPFRWLRNLATMIIRGFSVGDVIVTFTNVR